MIGQGVLGQIANPQMADIAGALDVREARIQRDEQRRKEIRMGQLISQAIPNLKEGSPLYQMALENPSGFMQFSKAAGIPLNDGERIQQFANDTTMLYQLAQQDPKDAYEWAVSTANERRQAGIEPVQLEKFIAGMRDDPVRTITGLTLTYRNVGDRSAEFEDRRLGLQERNISMQERAMDQGIVDKTAKQKEWEEYQRLKQEDPEAASQFARATGFETKEGQQLSSFAEKQIDGAFTEYTEASGNVNRYSTLAENLRKANMAGGLKSTWTEYIKEQTGNQDEITALRKEARQIATSEGIKNLPPGPATDRDIEIVLSPFPTEKASPEYIANWLDAMSRLNQKRAEYAEFKADFISANGSVRNKQGQSLVAAWKESQANQEPVQREQPAQPTATSRYKIEVLD